VAKGKDNITLELLGARLLALTAEVRDLQQRFAGMETRLGALETRFSSMEARMGALEGRFSVQEERMTRLIALVVRMAERQGIPPE
jgi:septal ring factor EnvC (AmiA/AmiB activator)